MAGPPPSAGRLTGMSSLADLDTLPKRLLHNAANWPRDVAMREKELGIWRVYCWSDCLDQIRLVALGLKALGVRRGEVVALMGRNRPNWVWGELAAQSLGCMTLGIYEEVGPGLEALPRKPRHPRAVRVAADGGPASVEAPSVDGRTGDCGRGRGARNDNRGRRHQLRYGDGGGRGRCADRCGLGLSRPRRADRGGRDCG